MVRHTICNFSQLKLVIDIHILIYVKLMIMYIPPTLRTLNGKAALINNQFTENTCPRVSFLKMLQV